ncbi:MAG: ABC transporter transmembrane domain-containing protein, partial [Spongiibacteraceae bacterium]|nr:ABC transporter transmembrane domain-containing protein [Spongiibacteraceae bacterium]
MADASTTDRRPALSSLRPMLGFLRPYRAQLAVATVALIFTATVTLSIGQGLRLLVDDGFASADRGALDRALLLFGGLVILLAIGTFARFYVVSWVGERVSADLRRAVYRHLMYLHPAYFETNVSGEIQSRITTDTTLLQTVVGSSVSIALRNLLILIGGVVLLFLTNVKLTLMVMLCVPLVVAPILIFGRRVRQLSRASQDRVAEVGTLIGESVKNIKVVQAFNRQELDTERFGASVEDAFRVARRRIYQRAWLSTLVITLVLGAVVAMIWVGGNDVLAGRTSAGELTAFIFYAVIVAGSVGAISEVYADLQRAAGASERLMELLAARSEIIDPPQPRTLPEPVRGDVRIEKVRFSYPTRPDTPALVDVTLEVPAGSTTALVGASGAGKSTLLDLLLRFYDVNAGAIRLDGVDIRELALADLRRHIALVPQQPVLFTGTIEDNIRYGRPDATEAEV